MNHSIYSADRTTHLKIVVVALVAGIAVAGLGIAARSTSDDYTQTARVMKPASRWRSRAQAPRRCANRGITGIHAALYQPPKVATWICRRPQLPPSRLLGKRPLPTGVFFLWGAMTRCGVDGALAASPLIQIMM